jgi:Beta-lactamase enzyme family
MKRRFAYPAAVLAAVVFAGVAQADVPGPITARVDNLLSTGGGTTGLYLKRVGGSVIAAKNENFAFEPASSIKVLIHLYAMQQVQNGLALSTPIPQYATVPDTSCPGDATGMTEPLSEALKKMMRYSDNSATKELMIYFGVGNLQGLANSLGMTNTHFELSADPPGFNVIGCQASGATNVDDNTTSLVDLGKIYEGVADSSLLNGSFREMFYERMAGKEMFEQENYDFTGVWGNKLQQIVDDETPNGLYYKKKQAFVDGMRENAKGGGYGKCLNNGCTTLQEWIIMDGWLQVPVCTGGGFSNRKYVWGVFIDGAVDSSYVDDKTTPADTAFGNAYVEPLREQVHDALANWSDCFETTPPAITLAVDPSDQVGASGWYNIASSGSDGVLAHFTATDASGIDFFICSGKQGIPTIDYVLADMNGTIHCTATDGVGNQAVDVPFPFKIDQTPPTVNCASPTPTYVLGGAGGNVSASVSDGLSGPTTATLSAPADVSSAGSKTVSLTGHDIAGNSTTVACPYLVSYNVLGFFSPLPKDMLSGGSTVPVKLALADAGGTRIPDAEAEALAAACAVTVEAGGPPVCMTYEGGPERFQANLKLPAGPGPATILAKVTIGGELINTLSLDVTLK